MCGSSASAFTTSRSDSVKFGWPFSLRVLKREHDVVGGERRAVGELCLGPQLEDDRHAVGRHLGAAGDEPVDGVRLVERARHQAVEQVLEPLRRVALEDEVVEAVEGRAPGGADHRQAAAFRGVGIDVVEVLEVGRILQLAERRKPMARFGERGRREQRRGNGESGEAE